ncbi:MAG: VirB3 family type IV secretion system protein [Spirochaetaceae bacterium]|nr:VirB3 family type IV secretion system protein [Spirochaetaceae bacterium]
MKERGEYNSHKALMQRELIAGIPPLGLLAIIMLAVVFVYNLEFYLMLIPIAALYIVMRILSKRDPFLVDIVLEDLMRKDVYLP